MGIAIREFEIAMETLGAERLPKKEIQYGLQVPSFKVMNTIFIHSGKDFVTLEGKHVPEEIMKLAKSELGHRYCDINLLDEIRSTRGLFTLALLLDNNYSKQSIRKLINETYSKIFSYSLFQNYITHPYRGIPLKKADTLYELLLQYDRVINPFGFWYNQKKPVKYLSGIYLNLFYDADFIEDPNVKLVLSNMDSSSEFISSQHFLSYYAECLNSEMISGIYDGYTSIKHYYANSSSEEYSDEILSITVYNSDCSSVSLSVSLKTGLACDSPDYFVSENSSIITNSQLDFLIKNLSKCVERTRKNLTSKIII